MIYIRNVHQVYFLFSEKDARIHELEKDLYYYKKVSRDLKKKMRELAGKEGALDPSQAGSVQSEVASEVELRLPVEGKNQGKTDSKLIDANLKVCPLLFKEKTSFP